MNFAIFDIETRIDKTLLKQVFYSDQDLDEDEACRRFREEQLRGEFFPTSLQIPVSIAVGNVDEHHVLRSVESLALSNYSEENLAREFWTRAERFPGCLVSFNGHRFDFPVMELQALRHGIAAPLHFAAESGGRHRYSSPRHLDLFDYLTNFGAFHVRGGLDLLCKMIGLPGKTQLHGGMVQEFYETGRLDEIHRYCRQDVVNTYFLFLRVELMRGNIEYQQYQAAREASGHFLTDEKS